jgi:Baseplate J-like protein
MFPSPSTTKTRTWGSIMADYVNPPISVDSTDIEDEIYDYIQTYFPNFEPREPHLAVVLSEAFAQQIADTQELASDVPPIIFRYFGRLVRVIPVESAPATALASLTMRNADGGSWDAGELVFRMLLGGDEYIGMENAEPVVVPPGSTTAGFVVTALEDGAAPNGNTNPLELLTVDDRILSVTFAGSVTGGADEEDEDSFLDRLTDRLQLLADRPIVPEDFETYTKALFPTISRVLVLDLYNPADNTYGNERMVTVVPIDADGAAMTGTHAAIEAALEAVREVTFIVHTMAPTYTPITVSATVKRYPGFTDADVKANVESAVASYLSPSNWGQPQFGDRRRWVKEGWDKVRFPEVMTVINNVEGVNYIVNDQITMNSNVNTNVDLTGEAPLPAPNPTVTITVVP